jgi:triosephosphate isomerase
MLKDAQVPWVILGHSERRHVMGETDLQVGEKTKRALDHDLAVMACIGEKIDERKAGRTNEVNARQLEAILKEVTSDWTRLGDRLVIAYEPVWAIGTGVVASPEEA